jgi:hypothetical protein
VGALAAIGAAIVGAFLAYFFKLRDERREGEAAQRLLEQALELSEASLKAILPKTAGAAVRPWGTTGNWTVEVPAWDSYGDRLARHLGGKLAAKVGHVVYRLRIFRAWMAAAKADPKYEQPQVTDVNKLLASVRDALKSLRTASDERRGLRRLATVGFILVSIGVGAFLGSELSVTHITEGDVAQAVEKAVAKDVGPGHPVAVSSCDLHAGLYNCDVVLRGCQIAQAKPPASGCSTDVSAQVRREDHTFAIERALLQELDPTATKSSRPSIFRRLIGRIGHIGSK